MNRWKTRLSWKLGVLMITAGIIATLIFVPLERFGEQCLELYFQRSGVAGTEQDELAEGFRQYVDTNHLSTTDCNEITSWVLKNHLQHLRLYKDGKLIYDSYYSDVENTDDLEDAAAKDVDVYDWSFSYSIPFTDGRAEMVSDGFYSYNYYIVLNYVVLLVCFAIFFTIVMAGVSRSFRYVKKLNEELSVVAGGNLDYHITVKGHDELGSLARNLDEMRISFKEKIEQNEEFSRANKELVTAMSHDLRTPLTTLILYIEILKNKKIEDEKEREEYIDKIAYVARQIQELSDNMFEYFLVSKDTDKRIEEYLPVQDAFYDALSNMAMVLQEKGFRVINEVTFPKIKVGIAEDYLIRIVDNILSNMLKYADAKEPVRVRSEYEENSLTLIFENAIREDRAEVEGTHLGVRNIENMMQNMNGDCEIIDTGGVYQTGLRFPIVKAA